ncbi:MAG: hypothetical protein LIO77_01235 [Rikenellaceae bacterium]|nr:hypothetical protein [Rikenellaceae bacterium]
MREVLVSEAVIAKVADLRIYLVEQLKLSLEAAHKRIDRIDTFLKDLSNEADYPLCRFKKWNKLGYRCAVCEKDWVFAYEVFEDGIIVRDMSHANLLAE